MGAKFMAGKIQGAKGVSNLSVKDDTEFSFDYEPSNNKTKHYKVYAPTRDDYEVSMAIIDKAVKKGCNLIVFDFWIFVTSSGKDYSSMQKIPIYSVPDFIKAVITRVALDND